MDVIIVMVLIFAATGIIYNSIKSFYLGTYSAIISTVIAAITSIMMFFSGMMLFYPKNYSRGTEASQVDLSIVNVAILFLIVGVIYYLFKYKPSRNQ
jgi:uncharacterized membrane protein